MQSNAADYQTILEAKRAELLADAHKREEIRMEHAEPCPYRRSGTKYSTSERESFARCFFSTKHDVLFSLGRDFFDSEFTEG